MGELFFAMSDIPDIHCHVFMGTGFEGTPQATPEAIPMWSKISEIPFGRMWEDDRYWLGEMLSGKTFRGRFTFAGEAIQWSQMEFGMSWEQEGE